jgi:hypothetical protein
MNAFSVGKRRSATVADAGADDVASPDNRAYVAITKETAPAPARARRRRGDAPTPGRRRRLSPAPAPS